MLIWLLASFGIVVAVNAAFIVLSVQTFRGEDEQAPYLQGIGYNKTLAERAEQAKLGWSASVDAARQPDGSVRIAMDLKRADGSPEGATGLKGKLRHPADENRDRVLQWHEMGAGHFVADLPNISQGAWDVVVSTPDGVAPHFEASRRTWVP